MRKDEREIWMHVFMTCVRTFLPEDRLQAVIKASQGPDDSYQKDMHIAASLNEAQAKTLSLALTYDFVRYLEDGRVLALCDAGAAASVVPTSAITARAAAGTHVYFQSIHTRPNFGEWLAAIEMSFFHPENGDVNDLFEMYIGCMPPGGGTVLTPAPDGAMHYITAGVPIAYKAGVISLASEFQLRITSEGAGVGMFGGGNIDIAVQWNPDKLDAAGNPEGEMEGLYLTPLRGPGIYQVSNTQDSGVYNNGNADAN